jgi:hypothetical protein
MALCWGIAYPLSNKYGFTSIFVQLAGRMNCLSSEEKSRKFIFKGTLLHLSEAPTPPMFVFGLV